MEFRVYHTLTSKMSLPLPSHIMGFDIKSIHQRIQTTSSHASCFHYCHYCHHCNVDFVLFHNVTCYANSLISCIRVNIADFLTITCTLIVTCMILEDYTLTYVRLIKDK